jgi:hypothetical protein
MPTELERARDPLEQRLLANNGFWLLESFDEMPTLADAVAAAIRFQPSLARTLETVAPTRYERPNDRPYYAYRTPMATVAARLRVSEAGIAGSPPNERPIYGVYMFLPNDVGGARLLGSRRGGGEARVAGRAPTAHDPLLDLYAQRFPGGGGRATTRLTPEMRIRLALDLADKTLLGEVGEAASDAIRDPGFIATTVLMIAVYVGLWLTPDPTFITKLLAAGLTALLIGLFTWHDIIGFARAWMGLSDEAAVATTEAQLRAAGDRFISVGGRVAFDILLMVAFWGMGRAARPGLRAARARIATEARVAAEARVAEARRAPATGVDQPAAGAEATRVAAAEAAAGANATPTQVLDAIARELPEAARQGLEAQRAGAGANDRPTAAGDARTLNILRARQRAGTNIARWLQERAMTPEERAQARRAVAEAEAALLRARMIEADAIRGSAGARRAVEGEFRRTLLEIARALLRLEFRLRELVRARDVRALVGELGEAVGRVLLRTAPEARPLRSPEVVSNLELARRVAPGTVADYAARERAAGRPVDVGRLRQGRDGVYESLGQIDNMLAERQPDGRLRPVVLEEVKTGEADQPIRAQEQVERARATLADIGAGTTNARVMERPSPNAVGADVTTRFNLARAGEATARTRGLAGRGFTESLGADRPALEEVARQLVSEGLPGGEPPTIVTRPVPRDREPAGR